MYATVTPLLSVLVTDIYNYTTVVVDAAEVSAVCGLVMVVESTSTEYGECDCCLLIGLDCSH